MKTKKTLFNSITSLLYYAVTVIMGILNRKAVIAILGIEYQGINGLFGNILSMLSIAELGIGVAIVYHMYSPVRENDTISIKALMDFYRRCYLVIGSFVIVVGIVIIPLLPHLVKDYSLQYPISQIYIWFLLDSGVSYFLSYRRSILIADQSNYIINLFDTVYALLVRTAQIVVIILTKNFIAYLVCMFVFRLADNVLIYSYTNRRYPYLKEKGIIAVRSNVLEDIKTKVKGAVFHKIGGFVVLGTDNILISSFFGLSETGIYSNYYLIINTLYSVITMCITSATASVGHLLLEEDHDRSTEVFKEIRMTNFLITCIAATGIYCLATPMICWLFGEEYSLDRFTVLVLAVNFVFQAMRGTYLSFKEAAGILYEDRWVPVAESVINIVASIVLLQYFGLAGVFMGTIVSSLLLYGYSFPILVFKGLLKQKISEYYIELFWEGLVVAVCFIAANWVCSGIQGTSVIFTIFAKMVMIFLVSTFILVVTYVLWKKETKGLFHRIKNLIHE